MASSLRSLTFDAYVNLIVDLLSRMGFEGVKIAEKSQKRGKAILIAEKKDEFGSVVKYLVSLVGPTGKRVGAEEVRTAIMLMEAYEADRLIVVSSSHFTEEARREAKAGVRLIDVNGLLSLLSKYGVNVTTPSISRGRRVDIPSIIRRLKTYSPPDFPIYSSTTEEVLRKVYSKLREKGLMPEEVLVKEMILEVEPLYRVEWVASGRDYSGDEVDESGTVYIGPGGEIYTPSFLSSLLRRKEDTRTSALIRLKKSRRRISPGDFTSLLRGVKLREVGRLERDRVKAMSLVKDLISDQLEISRDKVRIADVEKVLVGTKWVIYLETPSGLGEIRYYEVNDLVSEPELPVMSQAELEEEVISWFASRYGELCDVERVELDGLWATFWVTSPQHVGKVKIHRTTGRIAEFHVYLGRDAVTKILEERLGGRVLSLSRMEDVYEALLELDEEYVFVRASAEDGGLLEMNRIQTSLLKEMALDSISSKLPVFEWSVTSLDFETPKHLSVVLTSIGGTARFRYDLSIGEGRLIHVEVNEGGAAEMIRSAFPRMELVSLESEGDHYLARLEDKCWAKEVAVPKDGRGVEVMDSRIKRVCAEEIALSEWEKRYGVRPNVVSAEYRSGKWSIEGIADGWEYRIILSKDGALERVERRISRELAIQKARSLITDAREVEVRESRSSPRAWIIRLRTDKGDSVYLKMDWESGEIVDKERFSGWKGKLKEKVVVSRRFS